jgi:glutathione S-transferase
MYTVIGPVMSRTMRVLWMLEEIGASYTHQPDPPRSEAVRRHNPLGKVPVLIDGSATLTDSTAILTYLGDRHRALTRSPGTHARARQDAVTQFLLDELDSVLWMAARHSFVLPEERRVPAIRESLEWEFAQGCDRLAARLGDGPFLSGEEITIPDLVAAHCLGWARATKFPDAPPPLVDYVKRLRGRPAFQRVQARAA